jgi:hypothetical protein
MQKKRSVKDGTYLNHLEIVLKCNEVALESVNQLLHLGFGKRRESQLRRVVRWYIRNIGPWPYREISAKGVWDRVSKAEIGAESAVINLVVFVRVTVTSETAGDRRAEDLAVVEVIVVFSPVPVWLRSFETTLILQRLLEGVDE